MKNMPAMTFHATYWIPPGWRPVLFTALATILVMDDVNEEE